MNGATEKTEKNKKKTRILVIVLVIVVAILIVLALIPVFLSLMFKEYRTISGIPEPEQTNINSGMLKISGENWVASAEYKAKYRIQGLVVGVEDYIGGSLYDRIAPRDVSLAWGDAAAHSNLIWWQRGYREINADISLLTEWIVGKKAAELFAQFSNNHIIVNDDAVKNNVLAIKRGDYVMLEGYLVNVRVHERNNENEYYVLNTSLSRTDSGDESCEVMYVTKVEWLD